MSARVAGESRALRRRTNPNVSPQWRVERRSGDTVAIPERLDERAGDDGVAEAPRSKLQRGDGVLDFQARADRDSDALRALGELSARWILVAPAGFGKYQDGLRELFDGPDAARRVGSHGGEEDLELSDWCTDLGRSSSIGRATRPASSRPARTASASPLELPQTMRIETCG